ncbi:MAG: YihA family ribosome biogenesis GTP-binding protein [Clostridiales bacterium]|nr:YihA family ribosome biogenesis GTP-binding protein [Clostridiales bacterium]
MKLTIQKTALEVTAGLPEQFPQKALPQIAFSGRSNVGKSSLINSLLGRKSLARVSSVPGKTVTVNFYNVDEKLYIVDLPGYGYAKRTPAEIRKWSALTDGYFTSGYAEGRLQAVVQLIDLKVGVTKDDAMMLDFMNASGIPYIVAATKCDKLNKTQSQAAFEKIQSCEQVADNTPIVLFSSLKKIGKEELWNKIFNFC